jgi:pyruvate,orthophosphate dikinase
VQGVIASSGNPRFAYDCYRRFVSMYGDVVLGCKPEHEDERDPFEEILEAAKEAKGVAYDTGLDADDLKELVAKYKVAVKERTGHEFPDDPRDQLWGAINAVFGSWDNDRAVAYRRLYGIPDSWGTAVNVQTMVYGNTGEESGTGVAFTRDPATGENVFYGEFLVNAQGEDVVAGVRTPRPVIELKDVFPPAYRQLLEVRETLERELRDMQDFEFTIEKGRLYMLQTRNGKRTGLAAIRIAVDMAESGLITPDEALMRVEPEQLNQLLRPIFSPEGKRAAVEEGRILAKGLAAGPGAASGRVVFNAPDAEAWAARGEKVLLVRIETSPEDIRGMDASQGILTARGGMTSHAALVARQMGKVAVVGCEALAIDYPSRTITVDGKTVGEGDWLSIDGFSGEVIVGQLETRPSEVLQVLIEKSLAPEQSETFKYYEDMMKWADAERRLLVRTNADQPDQAGNAIAFGAQGIGLCRTEHMFFEGERITAVREMILADTVAEREAALAKLLPMQRDDFAGIFRVMGGLPVTIRTLDPPLHEFMPHTAKEQEQVAAAMGVSAEQIAAKVEDLHEANPMLGHRGCRLGVAYPEITAMQVRAILEAACLVKKEGSDVRPEIMIPLVGTRRELEDQAAVVREVAAQVFAEQGISIDYLVGTMIEIPRAALTAGQIAEVAEFFSFGTNDLTQMTFGVSRDDAGKFLPLYTSEAKEIWPADPFATLDVDGVGQLVELGIERGRGTRGDLKVGICGEQGGDPATVKFCHGVGMNYVSCSPFRIPVARLAAAQAALEARSELTLEK